MDSLNNPYAPGAGAIPPELAGRDELRREIAVSLSRFRLGRSARSTILVGLRGVGKTVLLEQLRADAEADHAYSVRLEAEDARSLPASLAPMIRSVLLRLSRIEAARSLAVRGLRALAGFAKGLKITYQDIELTLHQEPEIGLADNGSLESDLTALLEELGKTAKSAGSLVALFIDEMQYIPEDQLSALISALHRCSQDRLPIALVGAGLPQIRALAGNAKSYAERLIDFRAVDPLSPEQARLAIAKPAMLEGVSLSDDAVQSIVEQTLGYPYFIQEWCRCTWDVAPASPMTREDVRLGSTKAIAMLDESFFSVRFQRVTRRERDFLRGMAELGPGPHVYTDVAALLADADVAPETCREELIKKGMIWEPTYNRVAFTTPLFDGFMKRRMPTGEWKPGKGVAGLALITPHKS